MRSPWIAAIAAMGGFAVFGMAQAAVQIDGGPGLDPPGGITYTGSGDHLWGQRTWSFTVDPTAVANLWYGINPNYQLGITMDGAIDGSGGVERLQFTGYSPNSMSWTGTTQVWDAMYGAWRSANTLFSMTFSGPGSVVFDPTIDALDNGNADVGAFWKAEGSFVVTWQMLANAQGYSTMPVAQLYGNIHTSGQLLVTSVATAFYWENLATVPSPGDANGDGKVDDLDATILASNWLKTDGATWAQGDFSGDGNVNDLDASILAANWQYGVGAPVPEPTTLALLLSPLLAAAVLAARRRK